MKKFKTMFAMMLALVGMCVAFTACSSDDDDEAPATPAALEFAGTYQDDMTCTVSSSTDTYEDVTFTIVAKSETTVDITLPGFGNPPMQLPAITLEGVKVTTVSGVPTIAEQEFSGELSNGKKYTCTIAGEYKGGKLTLNYSLQYGNMPFKMICSFTSAKK